MMQYRTYPHDAITELCSKKYKNRWDVFECVMNSIALYYGYVKKEFLIEKGEKFVEVGDGRQD